MTAIHFLIQQRLDSFCDRGIEVVIWDKSLNKDHPLLQKAKAECEKLNPPLHKSVATRVWNKSTPETFVAAWEARKAKHLKQGKKSRKYSITRIR